MKIEIAGQWEVDRIWPLVREGMLKACKHCDDWTPGTLWQLCRSGNGFLIVAHDERGKIWMASIWQFDGDALRCIALYGEKINGWVDQMHEYIKTLGRENGAKRLVARGRRGWIRLFGAVKTGKDYEVMI